MNHRPDSTPPGIPQRQTQSDSVLREHWSVRLLLAAIFVIAGFLRFFQLDTVPMGLLWDEAFNATDALRIVNGARPVFLTGNFGREALMMYLQAFSIAALGQTDLAMRIVSAVVGTATVAASYVLIRRLFRSRVALLTCAWLSVSFWHVMLSRLALRTVLLPLVCVAAFYCLWRGLETCGRAQSPDPCSDRSRTPARTRYGWFALAGTFIGMSLYTYLAARFVPVVVLALATYLILFHCSLLRQAFPGFIVAGAIATVVFVPEAVFFVSHPDAFFHRAAAVSILLKPGSPPMDTFRILGQAAIHNLGIFSFVGDGDWARNIAGQPIFDPVSSIFLLVGLVILVRRFREPPSAFVLLWLLVMLAPSLLATKEVPNNLRISGLIPALYVLPATAASWTWDLWDLRGPTRLRLAPVAATAAGLAVGAALTYRGYFGVWAHDQFVSSFFNADRWLAIQVAREQSKVTGSTVFVAAGDSDEPLQVYLLSDQPDSQSLKLFDGTRSLILASQPGDSTYVFASRDIPPHALLQRYFLGPSGRVVATAPDGETITLYRLARPSTTLEPERSIPARFGDQVQVFGFDVPRDVDAGGTLAVRWYWQLTAPVPRELAFFNQLHDAAGRLHGQLDDRAFAPADWAPGTEGISTFEIVVDPAAESGAYWLDLGVYERQTLHRLTAFDERGRPAGGQIRVGPIKVHGRPWPTPAVESPHLARFADQIDFLGYNVDRRGVGPDQVAVTLFWKARGRPSRDYTVFVHLLDSSGRLRGQADGPPQSGRYPTSVWDSGEVIADRHVVQIGQYATSAAYQLELGLYEPETGRRLALDDRNGQSGDHVLISNPPVGQSTATTANS